VLTEISIGLAILIVGLVFLFVARRILRLALKIALAVALVFVLLAGAAVAWWQGWFDSSSSARRQPAQTPASKRK
jgi:cell division protein FtsW (lipid II flippase)